MAGRVSSTTKISLKESLAKNLVEAAKARDQVRLDTIRSIQSAIRYKEIEKKETLSESDSVTVIASLAKKVKESIEQFEKGGRTDLVEKELKELKILQEYLPEQLTEEEVRRIVEKVIQETGAKGQKEIGLVMKGSMKELSGKADGNVVSQIVRSFLGGT